MYVFHNSTRIGEGNIQGTTIIGKRDKQLTAIGAVDTDYVDLIYSIGILEIGLTSLSAGRCYTSNI